MEAKYICWITDIDYEAKKIICDGQKIGKELESIEFELQFDQFLTVGNKFLFIIDTKNKITRIEYGHTTTKYDSFTR